MKQQAIKLFKRWCPKGQKQAIINQNGRRILVAKVDRKIVAKEISNG